MAPEPETSPGVVVVTGASAGVGRAVAVAFARRGWRVGLLARGEERLRSAAAEVERAGGRALALSVDVADASAVQVAASEIAARFAGIDVWINNAMATVYGRVIDVTPEEFERVTQVTYLGTVHGTLAALKHMRPQYSGVIVQIGSALAYRSIPLQAAYCAAKFAIRGFTDALRTELIHEGSAIQLTMVQLPAVDTPQFDWSRNHLQSRARPVPPVFTPEAIAEQIVRAAMSPSREVWIGAPAMRAIVGAMVAPQLTDRLAASQAWHGQMDEAAGPPRGEDNLFEPVAGDVGTRGRFGSEAIPDVVALSGAALRVGGVLFAGLALAGSAAVGAALARRQRRARTIRRN